MASPSTVSLEDCSPDEQIKQCRRLGLLEHSGHEHDNFHEIKTAPVFIETARVNADAGGTSSGDRVFSQYGLLAGVEDGTGAQEMLHYNTAAPSSTFICGSQGSGKSHSLSCILENCLFSSEANELPRPLTGIVFHYGESCPRPVSRALVLHLQNMLAKDPWCLPCLLPGGSRM